MGLHITCKRCGEPNLAWRREPDKSFKLYHGKVFGLAWVADRARPHMCPKRLRRGWRCLVRLTCDCGIEAYVPSSLPHLMCVVCAKPMIRAPDDTTAPDVLFATTAEPEPAAAAPELVPSRRPAKVESELSRLIAEYERGATALTGTDV